MHGIVAGERELGHVLGRLAAPNDPGEVLLGGLGGLLAVRAADDEPRQGELRLERVAVGRLLARRSARYHWAADRRRSAWCGRTSPRARPSAGCCCRPTSSSSPRPTRAGAASSARPAARGRSAASPRGRRAGCRAGRCRRARRRPRSRPSRRPASADRGAPRSRSAPGPSFACRSRRARGCARR